MRAPLRYRSAFEDLQTGAFVAGLGLLMGVVALLRMRQGDRPRSNP